MILSAKSATSRKYLLPLAGKSNAAVAQKSFDCDFGITGGYPKKFATSWQRRIISLYANGCCTFATMWQFRRVETATSTVQVQGMIG
jgi:hypothetical protein